MATNKIRSDVWIRINGEFVGRTKPHSIFTSGPDKGVLGDGRPVKFEDSRWIYDPV